MVEWVALLRGVNVGGVSVRSAELRELCEGLGLDDVRTVLATGNVVFASDAGASEREALTERIERALSQRFEYDASLLLITADELDAAIAAFPFDADDATRQPWMLFCRDDATRDELVDAAAALDGDLDPVASGPGVVYWNPPKGRTTDTPFAKLIAKARYKTRTTNRNLRTAEKIKAAAVS